MRRMWLAGVAALAAVGLLTGRQPPLKYDWRAVDQKLEAKLTSVPVPGVSLLVRHHGAKVYEKAFGSYTANTVVPIASGSKWLTGATMMTLVDDGRLTLDTTVGSVLPQFTGAARSITVRQLLSHTGGFGADPGCVGNQTMTLAACVNVIASRALAVAPGQRVPLRLQRHGRGGADGAGADGPELGRPVPGSHRNTGRHDQHVVQRAQPQPGRKRHLLAGRLRPLPADDRQ